MGNTFAERLRAAMKERRVGATELARRAGVGRQSVYDWLKGGGITDETLTVVARELGTDAVALKYGQAAEPPRREAKAAASAALDEDILRGVIVGVERALKEAGIELPPEKKAEVVLLLYRLEAGAGAPLAPDIIRSLITITKL